MLAEDGLPLHARRFGAGCEGRCRWLSRGMTASPSDLTILRSRVFISSSGKTNIDLSERESPRLCVSITYLLSPMEFHETKTVYIDAKTKGKLTVLVLDVHAG
jgi:hypothetical protein